MNNSENPFVLLARITVKEGVVDEYLEIAEAADKAVEKTEEGMLFHNFDRDPDDQHKFVWTEVYRRFCPDGGSIRIWLRDTFE